MEFLFMKTRIGLIHTTPLVQAPVDKALEPLKKEYDFFQILDEAVLYRMMKDGNTPGLTVPWLQDLADRCVRGGASGIIVSCSSLSPSVLAVQEKCPVPIVRIDEMVYRSVLGRYKKPVILMTNPTNQTPATLLVQEVVNKLNLRISVPVRVCPGAFEALQRGERDVHDNAVVSFVDELLQEHDAVIFSQISMAGVRMLLPVIQQKRVHLSLDYMEEILDDIQVTLRESARE